MFFTAATALSLGVALLSVPVQAVVHDIDVGGTGDSALLFKPEAIFASVGDQIIFHFKQKNHTVTQSSLQAPCSAKAGGFDSGFQPVPANQTDSFPTYTITVNDTAPIWAFCAQAAMTANTHCGKGMIFSANCGADGAANSFTNFKKEALAIGAQLAAAASASSGAPAATSAPPASSVATAAYGGVTIPPAPQVSTVVQTVTLASSTWTTTYASYPNSPAPTPASLQGNVIKVIVGGNSSLTFDPPSVKALPMDTIVFEFRSKNHTVTESAFADPCRRKADAASGAVTGFDSGFWPVAADATTFPTWNLTINGTAPTWVYCRQKTPASHCGSGMVFAINSDDTSQRSFSAFQSLAKQLNGTVAAVTNASTSASGSAGAVPTGAASSAGALRSSALTAALGAVAAVFIAFL